MMANVASSMPNGAVERPSKSAAMLCLLLAAGCAGNGHTAAREAAQATAAAVPTASIEATATPPVPPPDQPPDQAPARAPEPLPAPRPAPLPASAHASRTDPPLDLGTLETRLRETKAIGVFTKLTVKNQVDDLLDRFRAYHKGQLETSLAELRRAYDMLVLKVMALLQDADAALARALAVSRESIWGILSDSEKFSKVQS